MTRILIAAIFAIIASASMASAQSCPEIRFAKGAYSGGVGGVVSDGAPQCYTFGTGNGQTARLQLSGSNNACFSVVGLADCQTDFSFVTSRQTYRVFVVQLFPSPAAEQFGLTLSIY
ncbi:hypothetical protein [Primorskyibacter flagellatus]|uniref:Uncharacterized protein n=1 Tax=Primorskyibacter flagellatus TaxID=1387277 RepID=A0A1W2D7K4_9RHOB|nr:hypothetical protein [Primorskyibacter flagellatus]SMC93355.1 hypothetical protein SAMN06295998_11191 [Primorskyibacter flagellatus]